MNKIRGVLSVKFIFVILILSSFYLVSAQEIETEFDVNSQEIDSFANEIENAQAGASNGVTRTIDRIRLAISGNNPELALKIAAKRLEQIEKLRAEGKIDEANKLAKNYEQIISNIEVESEDLEIQLKRQAALEALEMKIAKIEERLANSDLTDEQKEKVETLIQKIRERNSNIEERIQERKTAALEKIAQEKGLSEDEVKDAFNDKFGEKIRVRGIQIPGKEVTLAEVRYNFEYRGSEDLTADKEKLTSRLLEKIHMSSDEIQTRLIILNIDSESEDIDSVEYEIEEVEHIESEIESGDSGMDSPSDLDESDENYEEYNDSQVENLNDDSNALKAHGHERIDFKLEIKNKEDESRIKVEFRFRTVIESLEQETIISELTRLLNQITYDDLVNARELKIEDKLGDKIKEELDKKTEKAKKELEKEIEDAKKKKEKLEEDMKKEYEDDKGYGNDGKIYENKDDNSEDDSEDGTSQSEDN